MHLVLRIEIIFHSKDKYAFVVTKSTGILTKSGISIARIKAK